MWDSLLTSVEFSSHIDPLEQGGDKYQTHMVGFAVDAGVGNGLNYELNSILGYQCSELLPIYPLLNICIGQDLPFRLLGKELVFIWACLYMR